MHLPISTILGLTYGLSEVGLGIIKRSSDDSVDADDSSLRMLWIVILSSIAAAIFVAARVPAAGMDDKSLALLWVSCTLLVLGLALRWYSIVYLGRFFTVNVAIHASHEVIDTGPYARVRHPSYTGALLAFLGIALSLANWLSLPLVVVPVFWAFTRRMAIEETALSNALGSPYTNYMRRTKRLVPFIY